MPIMIYDTMSRKKREFKPLRGNRVNMFVCGPTVYDLCHLGHGRTYVAYDVIAKYLRMRGFSLFYLLNITDVDDKIIRKAEDEDRDPFALSKEMLEFFYKDMRALKVDSVNLYVKASEHIPEMINQISTLMKKGYAYNVEGDVYYDITKFLPYGRLSRQKPEELKEHRIDPNPKKRNPGDFTLWKKWKEGEPFWESPWGKGRPGWHIEDTAITVTYLGSKYDIHGGALELIFPHHEAEIAQAEAATGDSPLVDFWVHTGVLTIDGRKMSKSLKNFITLQEYLKTNSPEELRIFYSLSHYRSPIDYESKKIRQASQIVESLNRLFEEVKTITSIESVRRKDNIYLEKVDEYLRVFHEAMEDDFNTPKAISIIQTFTKDAFKYIGKKPSKEGLKKIIKTLEFFDDIFGFLRSPQTSPSEGVSIKLVETIIAVREELRKRRQFEFTDLIRDRMKDAGVVIEDTPKGTKWRYR